MISKPFKNTYFFLFSLVFFMMFSCKPAKPINSDVEMEKITSENDSKGKKIIITGAQQTYIYLPFLFSKNIAIVANQTSVILKKNNQSYTHLVDSLHALDVAISKVFSPEHGFRGTADASELVRDGIDTKTARAALEDLVEHAEPRRPRRRARTSTDRQSHPA
jgi:uncharacterized protein YbbC (DUF1343 family)